MIYMSMDANPFWYDNLTRHQLVRQKVQRAHINRDQDRFVIEACNVKIDSESVYEPDGVYLRGLLGNNMVHEVVWPISTPGGELFDFAVDFRKKAVAQNEPRHQQI